MIGVIAALDEEVSVLAKHLDHVDRRARSRIALEVSGMGPKNAERAARKMLEKLSLERLLIIGVSGAVTEGLGVGTLIAAREIIAQDGSRYRPDRGLVEIALARSHALAGVVISPRKLVSTPEEKARIALKARASRAVVDLESAAFADVAERAGVPYLVLRAVSDTADEALPSVLADSQAGDGTIARRSVALRALVHPGSWLALGRLRTRVHACAHRLAFAIEELEQCASH